MSETLLMSFSEIICLNCSFAIAIIIGSSLIRIIISNSYQIRAFYSQDTKFITLPFLGSFAPYGYLKDPKDKYKFIIDDYAADIIRRIYNLYLQGFSTTAICRILEDEKIPNPTVYKKEQGLTYETIQLMYTDRANGIISESMFIELIHNSEQEIVKQREKIQKIENEIDVIHERKKSKPDFENLLSKYFDYSVLTHEMVVDFVDYILIGRNDTENVQELSIYWNF